MVVSRLSLRSSCVCCGRYCVFDNVPHVLCHVAGSPLHLLLTLCYQFRWKRSPRWARLTVGKKWICLCWNEYSNFLSFNVCSTLLQQCASPLKHLTWPLNWHHAQFKCISTQSSCLPPSSFITVKNYVVNTVHISEICCPHCLIGTDVMFHTEAGSMFQSLVFGIEEKLTMPWNNIFEVCERLFCAIILLHFKLWNKYIPRIYLNIFCWITI